MVLPHREPPETLNVTLVATDVVSFAWGDHFVYELLIENIGKRPVTLPWSPDMGPFAQPVPRTPPGFVAATLSLHVETHDGTSSRLAILHPQSLYGSYEVPGSLLVLAPGKTAHIRVPAQWASGSDEREAVLRQSDGAVQLRAVVSIHSDDVPVARSKNTLPVRVIRRPSQK